MSEVTYRWVDGPFCTDAEWDKLEVILATRGWISLNRNTTRVLLAEDAEGKLLGFNVVQYVPYVGPLWVAPSTRGSGVAEDLADRTLAFMVEIQARGFLVIAQSKHSEKLCVERGMREVEAPVFMMGGTT